MVGKITLVSYKIVCSLFKSYIWVAYEISDINVIRFMNGNVKCVDYKLQILQTYVHSNYEINVNDDECSNLNKIHTIYSNWSTH